MIFWFIMSGFFDLVHGLMGVFSVAIVITLNYQLKKHQYFKDESDVLNELRLSQTLPYFFWLVYQIVASGVQVARILLTPSLPVETQMIRFKVNLPNAHAKMILGNSISLTPGTITVDIDRDEFLIHSIVPQAHLGITNDAMPQKVLNLFTKDLHPVVSDVSIITDNDQL